MYEKRFFILCAWTGLSLLCAACSSPEPTQLGTAPLLLEERGMVIRTADGRVFNGEPATIEVIAPVAGGPAGVATISLSGADRQGQGVSVSFDLTPQGLVERSFNVKLGRFPGAGTLAHMTSGGTRILGPGQAHLRVDKGRIAGSFQVSDAILGSGTIEGRYELACLVPPEQLGMAPNGSLSEGAWMLVEDETESSEFCKGYKGF
jgi:hypothetical protein